MSDLIQVTQKMPSLLRAEILTVAPSAINLEARTVDVIASTGACVLRYDWWESEYYEEELSLDPAHCKLGRLQGGASVLNSHGTWDLSDVIGSTVRAWIENAGLCATLKISDRDEKMEGIWRDIQAMVIRHISIGYRVRKYEIVKEEGKLTKWRAVDWEPYEISFVPIPADPGAGVRCFAIEGQHQRAALPQPEPCLFLRQPLTIEATMSDVIRKDPPPSTPAPELTPEQRLRKLEQDNEVRAERELKLIQENKRLSDDLAEVRQSNTDAVVQKIDAQANGQFAEDRAQGLHYWYTTEAEARADFNNNKQRYEKFTSSAPVVVPRGAKAGDAARAEGTNTPHPAHRNVAPPSPAAPKNLPSASELRSSDQSGDTVYRAVLEIQQAAVKNGRSLSYSEASDMYHEQYERELKLAQ
jgi:HK97 family phage prohead protease